MKGKLILVTGATGAVGPKVVSALLENGFSVRTFSNDQAEIGLFPEHVDERVGDITDSVAVGEAVKGVDAIVHLAAVLHIVNPPPELKSRYYEVNVGGTKIIVAEAIKQGVKQLVFASTIAVYGESKGVVLNEETPTQPDSLYGESKLKAEEIVLGAMKKNDEPLGTVLRFGAVYGPRIKGNYQRLVKALAKNRFLPVGKGDNCRSLVYVEDVARAVVLALEQGKTGKTYNVTDGKFRTVAEINAAICEALGKKPPCFYLPKSFVRLGVLFLELAFKLIRREAPITRVHLDKYFGDVRVDASKIQEELGFQAKYDLKNGWQETINFMRSKDGFGLQ
ncbi:MAG: NAD-dependent epimerase/dehydratase family protein [Lentisphaerae bacterium]|nr:NAD-dependent epimerase/dehydratase family protein [Lentisphaerota bacterium]